MDRVERIMVGIYLVATAYVWVCTSPPQISVALRQVVFPFQIRARGRTAAAEINASAWSDTKSRFGTQPTNNFSETTGYHPINSRAAITPSGWPRSLPAPVLLGLPSSCWGTGYNAPFKYSTTAVRDNPVSCRLRNQTISFRDAV